MRSLVEIIFLCLFSLNMFKVTFAKEIPSKEALGAEFDNGNVQCSSGEESSTDESKSKATVGQETSLLASVKAKVVQRLTIKPQETVHDKELENQPKDGLKQKVGGLIETLQQKTRTLAVNLYNKGDPVRYYWGKSWNVLGQISFERLSRKEQLDALMTALTDEITQDLPQSTGIDPVEIHEKGVKYLCADNGKISDLTTIKHVKTKMESEGDKVTLYITYTFKNLYFTYDTFYISIYKVMRLKGKLRLQYEENQVTLVVRIPNISKLVRNIVSKNCLLYIDNFQVNTLKFDGCYIETQSVYRRGVTEKEIGDYLLEKENYIKRKFETQVLVEIHRLLATTGAWICKDSYLGKDVQRRGGTLENFVYSPKFRRKCFDEKLK